MRKKPQTYKEALKLTRNVQLAYYVLGANKLGIEYEVLIPGLIAEFSKGDKSWRIMKSITPLNDSVAMSLATFKNLCNRFLREDGLPVTVQASVKKLQEVFDFMKKYETDDIVIKPQRGFGGAGVCILPSGREEIKKAFENAKEASLSEGKANVLVETFVHGENYRFLVLGDKVIAATYRKPAYVTGDGKSSVQLLIKKKNRYFKSIDKGLIPIDEETGKALALQKLTLDLVPAKGCEVKVRLNCNMCQGGSTEEYSSQIHAEYKKIAVKASQAVGLRLSGVDIISPDITDPTVEFAINEVNHPPCLNVHYLVEKGEKPDVATIIQQYILDNL